MSGLKSLIPYLGISLLPNPLPERELKKIKNPSHKYLERNRMKRLLAKQRKNK